MKVKWSLYLSVFKKKKRNEKDKRGKEKEKGNRLKIWKSEYTEVDQNKMMEVKQNLRKFTQK